MLTGHFEKLRCTITEKAEKLKSSLKSSKDKEMDVINKLERSLHRLMTVAAASYKAKGLEGSVSISSSMGPFSTSIDHDVVSDTDVCCSEIDEEVRSFVLLQR